MTDTQSHPASAGSVPPPSTTPGPPTTPTVPPTSPTVPPAPRWGIRVGVGVAIAVAIFLVMDWLVWIVLGATGITSGASVTSWTTPMQVVWILVAAFAGAGYTLAPMIRYTPQWWAWRAAGGVALAIVLFIVLDSQVWYFAGLSLPSNFAVLSWPSPLYQVWIAVAALLGARVALGRARLFTAPWWAWRAVGGALVGLGTYLATVWLPLYAVPTVQSYGVGLANVSSWLPLVGTVFSLLVGAAYATHPTRAFGPIEVGAGVFEILYLLVLVGTAPWALSVNSLSVSIGVITLMIGLIVVILISMAGDVVTAFEDFARPGERRAWQYPVPVEPTIVGAAGPTTGPASGSS